MRILASNEKFCTQINHKLYNCIKVHFNMPIITRSKTSSEQSSDLVTYPKNGVINRLWKFVRSRQG